MNLELSSTSLKFIGVASDNEGITIEDNIGFSTADLDSGFNYSDASPMFQDGSLADYPETDEVVFFLQAWQIPFNDALNPDPDATGTELTVARVRAEVLPAIDTATGTGGSFVYGDNLNEWLVTAPTDGWIKFRMFGLDVGGSSDAYYYDAIAENIKLVADDSVETDLSVVAAALTSTSELNLLKTSKIDENIAYVEKCYTLAKMRGDCKDEDEWRQHIMTLQLGRITAKVEFDSYANMFVAAQVVEYLDNYILKHGLEKPNT